MNNTKHTSFWAIIERRDTTQAEATHYWVDASGFDSKALLSESEEEIHRLLAHNVRFEHIDDPSGESRFHAIVSRLLEGDIDSLVRGLAKRLCDDIHECRDWYNLTAVSSVGRPEILGEVVARKYGVEVWRLPAPIETNSK